MEFYYNNRDYIKYHEIGKDIHTKIAQKTFFTKSLVNYSAYKLATEIDILLAINARDYPDLEIISGFPTGININEMVAHYSPNKQDTTVLKLGDVVKIDYGVCVNGIIYDAAYTVCVGFEEENKENNLIEDINIKLNLIKASKEAFEEAKKMMRQDQMVGEIGGTICEVIESYGFNTIKDICGHQIKPYEIHSGLVIPNYNCNSILPPNMKRILGDSFYAIEPYASTGSGEVFYSEDIPCNHYILNYRKYDFNSAKKIIEKKSGHDIEYLRRFKSLCFTPKWLQKSDMKFQETFPLIEHCYTKQVPIVEKSGGITSQYEETIYVK
jgi:methionyl aminopeptidase